MDAMGQVYHSLGLYQEARGLFAQALARRVAELGEKDPETLLTRGRLGRALLALARNGRRPGVSSSRRSPAAAQTRRKMPSWPRSWAPWRRSTPTTTIATPCSRGAGRLLRSSSGSAPLPETPGGQGQAGRRNLDAQQFAELDTLMADLLRESSGLMDSPPGSDSLDTATTAARGGRASCGNSATTAPRRFSAGPSRSAANGWIPPTRT